MNQDALKAAQHLVRQVVEELMEKLAVDVRNAFQGSLDRRNRSHLKIAKNFDINSTLRRNLKHYDPSTGGSSSRLRSFSILASAGRSIAGRLIVLVDESCSMMDSVIHFGRHGGDFLQYEIEESSLTSQLRRWRSSTSPLCAPTRWRR